MEFHFLSIRQRPGEGKAGEVVSQQVSRAMGALRVLRRAHGPGEKLKEQAWAADVSNPPKAPYGRKQTEA